jgi:hypothetical protein
VSEPLSPIPPSNEDYVELNAFAQYLARLLDKSIPTLELYWSKEAEGFVHLIDKDKKDSVATEFSKASSATAISFLASSGRLSAEGTPWTLDALRTLEKKIIDCKWQSAGLRLNNPFTSSFLLEALAELFKIRGQSLAVKRPKKVQDQLDVLRKSLQKGKGIFIQSYPPTAFLTQKVVRVLDTWGELNDTARDVTAEWAFGQLLSESVNVAAKGPDADVFELAYAVLTVCRCKKMQDMSPRQREAIEFAIGQFFDAQTDRGTWPRSRPLFLYPDFGNAYCYDFELLAQLLAEDQLHHLIHGRLKNLRDAANSLDDSKIRIDDGGDSPLYGWSTGHLRQDITSPESWSTASVFHTCYGLNEIVQEAIRRTLFANTSNVYSAPRDPEKLGFSGFLDSEFTDETGATCSLTETIGRCFVNPICENLFFPNHGLPFPEQPCSVPTGAIFYGPPGTSKTRLVQIIADSVGWPLLKLDPSHLTRKGFDRLHAETNDLFSMLLSSQRVVVLLDEFDELVRERSDGDSESASRFLTTAMLPKLAALSDARRIVYVLATNHIEHFDAAIRRPGRFDLIVPVLPPSLKAKKKQWPEIETKLAIIGTPTDGEYKEVEETIGALTYFECEAFVRSVGTVSDKAGIIDLANRTWNQSIIRGWNPETRKSDENLSNSALGWRERIETIARLPTGLAASV